MAENFISFRLLVVLPEFWAPCLSFFGILRCLIIRPVSPPLAEQFCQIDPPKKLFFLPFFLFHPKNTDLGKFKPVCQWHDSLTGVSWVLSHESIIQSPNHHHHQLSRSNQEAFDQSIGGCLHANATPAGQTKANQLSPRCNGDEAVRVQI